jgi:hypothetical protein
MTATTPNTITVRADQLAIGDRIHFGTIADRTDCGGLIRVEFTDGRATAFYRDTQLAVLDGPSTIPVDQPTHILDALLALAGQWERDASKQSVWDANGEAIYQRHATQLRELLARYRVGP